MKKFVRENDVDKSQIVNPVTHIHILYVFLNIPQKSNGVIFSSVYKYGLSSSLLTEQFVVY